MDSSDIWICPGWVSEEAVVTRVWLEFVLKHLKRGREQQCNQGRGIIFFKGLIRTFQNLQQRWFGVDPRQRSDGW
eukprot:13831379-Ditylum_brightwellii.AAC.1